MSGGGLSEQIIAEVAEVEGVSRTDLPPLREAIELDGLSAIVSHASDRPAAAVTIQFRYVGYTITVSDDGLDSIEE